MNWVDVRWCHQLSRTRSFGSRAEQSGDDLGRSHKIIGILAEEGERAPALMLEGVTQCAGTSQSQCIT
jgi:hypothetical protein